MDKNQSAMSYEDQNSDSGNRSGNEKLIDFPTNGNSNQFKIDSGGIVPPYLFNRSSRYTDCVSNSQEEKTMKVQINLNIEFTFDGKVEMLKVTQDLLPKQFTIDDVISFAIREFNGILEKKNSQYRINTTESIWNLYMSKKNGKPKQDLPALDRDNLLQDTQEDMFSLDTKDPNKLWLESGQEWQNYIISQDEGDEYSMPPPVKINNDPTKDQVENKETQIPAEINNQKPQKSSVVRPQKKQNENTKTCFNNLCSFSK
ncbi:hypothetical protein ABPG72_022049 [Tetrahymena utriculariae]